MDLRKKLDIQTDSGLKLSHLRGFANWKSTRRRERRRKMSPRGLQYSSDTSLLSVVLN